MKTKSCHCCEGTGRELDDVAVGREMRSLRQKSGLSLAGLGKKLGFHQTYLCDLEYGRRNWNYALIAGYRKTCV